MKKMKENPHEHKNISPYTMEGYLYVQEKRRCWGGECGWEGACQDRGKGWFSRNRIPGRQGEWDFSGNVAARDNHCRCLIKIF